MVGWRQVELAVSGQLLVVLLLVPGQDPVQLVGGRVEGGQVQPVARLLEEEPAVDVQRVPGGRSC